MRNKIEEIYAQSVEDPSYDFEKLEFNHTLNMKIFVSRLTEFIKEREQKSFEAACKMGGQGYSFDDFTFKSFEDYLKSDEYGKKTRTLV